MAYFCSTSARIIGWTEKVKRSSLVWLPFAWWKLALFAQTS